MMKEKFRQYEMDFNEAFLEEQMDDEVLDSDEVYEYDESYSN